MNPTLAYYASLVGMLLAVWPLEPRNQVCAVLFYLVGGVSMYVKAIRQRDAVWTRKLKELHEKDE